MRSFSPLLPLHSSERRLFGCEQRRPTSQSVDDGVSRPTLAPEQDVTSDDNNDVTLQPSSGLPRDGESRRPSVADGQVDSAMSIAQKVSLPIHGTVHELRLITEILFRYTSWVVRTPRYLEEQLLRYRVAMFTVSRL
jgi:hypothetical protein